MKLSDFPDRVLVLSNVTRVAYDALWSIASGPCCTLCEPKAGLTYCDVGEARVALLEMERIVVAGEHE